MRGESDIGWLAPVSNTSVGMHTGVCCTGAASSAPLVPFHGGLREITTHRSAYESLAGRSIAVGRSGALYARCSSPEPRRHRPRGSAHRPALTSYRRRGPAAPVRRGRGPCTGFAFWTHPGCPGRRCARDHCDNWGWCASDRPERRASQSPALAGPRCQQLKVEAPTAPTWTNDPYRRWLQHRWPPDAARPQASYRNGGTLMLRQQHRRTNVVPGGGRATATKGHRCCSDGDTGHLSGRRIPDVRICPGLAVRFVRARPTARRLQ